MTAAQLPALLRLARTAFPEREDKPAGAIDQWALGVLAGWRRMGAVNPAREVAVIDQLHRRLAAELGSLSDAALGEQLRSLAPAALQGGNRLALHRALLLVGEAAHRALGMRPFPVQLVGAMTLLSGRLAEMQTGEGKTLTAGVAASLAACAGVPVHVVTVNDYLAERDAGQMAGLFRLLGLRVGVVIHGIGEPQKRAAYACDVAYCTGKEMVFDYLRDRVAAGGRASVAQIKGRQLFGAMTAAPMMRGLHFAIVDEADSILIDEARTPLILAEKAGPVENAAAFAQALELARQFVPSDEFIIEPARREVRLTRAGRLRLGALTAGLDGPWRAAQVGEHLITQALRAAHLFHRDHQYLIDADGAVQIIDEYTGRVLPGRTWEQGLHQMIECKEGVAMSERTRTLARITYQRFFARYLRLSGMTGTAREMARELAVVYRLDTVTLPTHRPCVRRRLRDALCGHEQAKWDRVADEVARRHARRQPLLVGTRSVQASETLGKILTDRGIPHQVLNARQDEAEAAVISAAGEAGAVTVATNMAGRGTDIALGPGTEVLGGLCVILTDYHESPRIDRQLMGRCARQGQAGECIAVVSLDDDLFTRHGGPELRVLRLLHRAGVAPPWWLNLSRRFAQVRAERIHARTRRDTMHADRKNEQAMGFAGDPL